MRFSICVALVAFTSVVFAQAKSVKVTVGFPKPHCNACEEKLRAELAKVPGAKFNRDEKETVWTWLELTDFSKADLGAVAKAVAAIDIPHKSTQPPGLFLLLFKKHETNNDAIRLALGNAKGLDLKKTFNGDAAIWILLDDSGQAKLSEILKAFADAGIGVQIERTKDN